MGIVSFAGPWPHSPVPRPGRRRRATARIALAILVSAVGAVPVLGQQGTVAGTVTDAESLQPLAGVQVFVEGTTIGVLSGPDGAYRLEGVPASPATIAVRLIGYKDVAQEITIAAGQVVIADFRLTQTALRMQDIVVTGVVGATPKVKLPFVVERLDAESFPVSAANPASLLTGKSAGVTTAGTSGQPGQTTDLMLRGPTSINNVGRRQGPLIVIDGVIQSESGSLADINTLDIDHVEIVKGAAASSLYGSRAQAGVIEIFTKRGADLGVEQTNVLVRTEYGISQLIGSIDFSAAHPYVLNGAGTRFIDSFGNEVGFRDFREPNGAPVLTGESLETTFRDQPYPEKPFDQLGQFYDPGETVSVYGAVSGRSSDWSYRASGEWYRETGIIDCGDACRNPIALENFGPDYAVRDDGFERWNGRLSFDAHHGILDVAATGFVARSWQDDKSEREPVFRELLLVSPYVDLTIPDADGRPQVQADPGALEGNPLYWLAVNEGSDERRRIMGSLDLALGLTDWLRLEGNASYDKTDMLSDWLFAKDAVFCCASDPLESGGILRMQNLTDEAVNANLTASFNRTFLDGDLTTRARLRALGESQSFDTNGAQGQGFAVAGVPTFGAIENPIQVNNEIREIKSLGYSGVVSGDYKGRYILDGLVRRDGSSLFGPAERWHTYVRGSAAWRVSQEPFWNLDVIDELKLRFSIGTAGGRPNFVAQYETFFVNNGAIFPRILGNPELVPEHSVERELGVDMVLFGNLGIDLTYAWGTTNDQILLVPQPGFVGFTDQWLNAGEIKSRTWEASLRWAPIDEPDTGLSFRLNWDRSTARISRLDIPEYTQSGFWHAEGEVIGSLWGARFSEGCLDVARSAGLFSTDGFDCSQFQLNDEGYMVFVGEGNEWTDGIAGGLWGTTGEVDGREYSWGMPIQTSEQNRTCLMRNPGDRDVGELCPLLEQVPVGSTEPDFNAALATTFRYRGLSVNVLFDATVGFDLYNGTKWNGHNRDRPLAHEDQIGKPDELKKPLRYADILYQADHRTRQFLEPGGWLKLRELAIGYTLPEAWTSRWLGGAIDRLTLTAIGRNLLTFTNYSGLDPEVGFPASSVGSAAIDRWDTFQYPNSRTISLALEVVF